MSRGISTSLPSCEGEALGAHRQVIDIDKASDHGLWRGNVG